MPQQDDDILFTEIGVDAVNVDVAAASGQLAKQPVGGRYRNLREELLEKCDPACYMQPYDPAKVDIANELYSQVRQTSDEQELKPLRHRAMMELGVKFSTFNEYELLTNACDPKRFTGNRYDSKKLALANRLYNETLENADDIEYLENLIQEGTVLIKEYRAEYREEDRRKEIQEEEERRQREEVAAATREALCIVAVITPIIIIIWWIVGIIVSS